MTVFDDPVATLAEQGVNYTNVDPRLASYLDRVRPEKITWEAYCEFLLRAGEMSSPFRLALPDGEERYMGINRGLPSDLVSPSRDSGCVSIYDDAVDNDLQVDNTSSDETPQLLQSGATLQNVKGFHIRSSEPFPSSCGLQREHSDAPYWNLDVISEIATSSPHPPLEDYEVCCLPGISLSQGVQDVASVPVTTYAGLDSVVNKAGIRTSSEGCADDGSCTIPRPDVANIEPNEADCAGIPTRSKSLTLGATSASSAHPSPSKPTSSMSHIIPSWPDEFQPYVKAPPNKDFSDAPKRLCSPILLSDATEGRALVKYTTKRRSHTADVLQGPPCRSAGGCSKASVSSAEDIHCGSVTSGFSQPGGARCNSNPSSSMAQTRYTSSRLGYPSCCCFYNDEVTTNDTTSSITPNELWQHNAFNSSFLKYDPSLPFNQRAPLPYGNHTARTPAKRKVSCHPDNKEIRAQNLEEFRDTGNQKSPLSHFAHTVLTKFRNRYRSSSSSAGSRI